jgi:hypothetical protein
VGGVFGAGGQTRIEEMYEKLIANWQRNDQTIDIIGFSRGAALAVHFSNVITNVGIKAGNQVLAQPAVRFLGVWDIVGSFGIPINAVLKFQELNIGYELTLSDQVQHCFHAMALNERRQTFNVTRLDPDATRANVEERWFRGVHSDVGGGNGNTALSNIALRWMIEKGRSCGLTFDDSAIRALQRDVAQEAKDATAPLGENLDPIKNERRQIRPTDRFHPSAVGKKLGVGESHRFTVRAPEQYSWSGVQVEAGAHYAFLAPAGQEWRDKDIVCGPDGWRSKDLPWYKEAYIRPFEDRRRCPNANWFELIGAVGEEGDNFFRIGQGGDDKTYQAPSEGELFAFANDLRTMYGNNHGELEVIVTRVANAGATRLKSCEEA